MLLLIYHGVKPEPDPMQPDEIDAAGFRRHMDTLAEGFNVLPLGEAVGRLRSGTLPARAACITFDDGYENNVSIALPILRERSLPACFFIATGFLDGECMWNDVIIESLRATEAAEIDLTEFGLEICRLAGVNSRRAAARSLLRKLKRQHPRARAESVERLLEILDVERPAGLMMSSAQVRMLAEEGMEIGAHTISHPILTSLTDEEAREEIHGSKERLESIIGQSVGLFAYPNGRPGQDFSTGHIEMLRESGFAAAVTTATGAADGVTDPFLLPRFTPWDRSGTRFTLRLYQCALGLV